MPSGGQNRIPTALKELRGTLRPSRENTAEPRLEAKRLPGPPKNAPDDEKVIWRKLKRQIDMLRVATAADETAFSILVDAVVLHLRTKADPNATVQQKDRARDGASRELSRWGLNPVDRARVIQLEAPADDTSPLSAFEPVGRDLDS